MTTPRPAPPEGRASWLDYVLDPCQVPKLIGMRSHARAELAELRKALAEAQGKLAIATANAAELAQQRDGALAKWDERLMGLRTYCAYCGHEEPIDADGALIARHIAVCEAHPMRAVEHARDSLRAQVAELRGAVLEMDTAVCKGLLFAGTVKDSEAWDSFVSRLRAEATGAAEPGAALPGTGGES